MKTKLIKLEPIYFKYYELSDTDKNYFGCINTIKRPIFLDEYKDGQIFSLSDYIPIEDIKIWDYKKVFIVILNIYNINTDYKTKYIAGCYKPIKNININEKLLHNIICFNDFVHKYNNLTIDELKLKYLDIIVDFMDKFRDDRYDGLLIE